MKALLNIYAPYVEKTAVTFEYNVPSETEFLGRIENISRKYPWIVYEENGEILGYAYGGPEYTRDAFQWTVESSVYVSESARGKGIGTLLYKTLFDILKKQNFCVCSALITESNRTSVKIHESFGFETVGTRKNCGFKHGKWHSLVIMEKRFCDFSKEPKPIIPITELNYEF